LEITGTQREKIKFAKIVVGRSPSEGARSKDISNKIISYVDYVCSYTTYAFVKTHQIRQEKWLNSII
jgi:hypothetical protein